MRGKGEGNFKFQETFNFILSTLNLIKHLHPNFCIKCTNINQMTKYYLLLGTNQGNRKSNIESALQKIGENLGKIKIKSSLYETEAWGMEDQPHFLNMVCLVESDIMPSDFLREIKNIEKEGGRVVTEKWGPRVIDIDILYIDDKIINTETLKVPHPGIYDRNFVLIPFIEISGDWIDPLKKITVDEIYDQCNDSREVYVFEEE